LRLQDLPELLVAHLIDNLITLYQSTAIAALKTHCPCCVIKLNRMENKKEVFAIIDVPGITLSSTAANLQSKVSECKNLCSTTGSLVTFHGLDLPFEEW
jgi:hypothetical protein